jgi:cytoskeletal protein CcmA (bactofilin family)
VALVAAGVALAAGTASAQSDASGLNHNDQVVLNGRLVVSKDQTVDNAVILNGPAQIVGTVRDTLFVLNGNVDVWGTVGKDVVCVNGDVVIHSGAHVGGDLVTQSSPQVEPGATISGRQRNVATRIDLRGLGFASRFVWWVGYSASTLFLGLLLLLLFPALDAAAGRVWRDRAGEAVGFGVAAFFLLPIAAVLFLVTIVGIPLGLFLLLALALVDTVGYVAGTMVLGRLLVKPPSSRFLAFLLGWVILRAIGLVPILGGFVWLVTSLVGLGVLAVAGRRATPAAPPAAPASPPPPPPPPPAPATIPA